MDPTIFKSDVWLDNNRQHNTAICWRLPGEYGSQEDSPVVLVECSETPIRLPGTSTSNGTTCTSTLVVSTGRGFVGPGGCPIQDTEHWCRGYLYDTDTSIVYGCHGSDGRDNMTRSLSNGNKG